MGGALPVDEDEWSKEEPQYSFVDTLNRLPPTSVPFWRAGRESACRST